MATLYGPSKVSIDVMTILEETHYPFEPVVRFRFSKDRPVKRSFSLRIPVWCKRAILQVNGVAFPAKAKAGTWATVRRTFRDGDTVEVTFSCDVKMVKGPEQSAAYTWGPLVFSLPIAARRRVEKSDKRSTSAFPAWTLTPASAWNYGVITGRKKSLVVGKRSGNPWTPASAPVRLKIEARRLPGWKMKRTKKLRIRRGEWFKELKGDLRFTPAMPSTVQRSRKSSKREIIELIPLGATSLRVTWFPVIRS